MNPLVSVIIPAYNVECYVKHTIESVINQTYKNIEVILVDDGSIDRTSDICDYYQERDKRVTVIHQTNQGLSEARNIGTCNSSGDFVFYLDGDDYLEENAILELCKSQEHFKSEIVISNYYYSYSDHKDIAEFNFKDAVCLSKNEIMDSLSRCQIQNFAWGKLIKTDIAKKNKFPEGKLFEDIYWFHNILNDCNIVSIVNMPTVYYVQRDNSISFSFDIKRLDMLGGWKTRITFFAEKYPCLVKNYLSCISHEFSILVWLVFSKIKENKKQAYSILRSFSKEYNLESYATKEDGKLIRAFNKSIINYAFVAAVDKIIIRCKR